MKGPATKMYEACRFSSENVLVRWGEGPEHGAIRTGCASATEGVTEDQLSAMDVASEVMVDGRLGGLVHFVEGAIPASVDGEAVMLRALLDRAVNRKRAKK